MPQISDLVSMVRGPVTDKPLVGIWALPPCTAGVIGGIPNMIRYYFDVDEWSEIMAATVIATIIPASLYLFLQNFLVKGFTEGALKQ